MFLSTPPLVALAAAASEVITVTNRFAVLPLAEAGRIASANASWSRRAIRLAPGLSGSILLTTGELRIIADDAISGGKDMFQGEPSPQSR